MTQESAEVAVLRGELAKAMEQLQSVIKELVDARAEIVRLQEYEWMYKDLCK